MMPRLLRVVNQLRSERRAAAMVEFAIVAPVLFVLIFGIIDFGRVFFLYNNLTNAAREGARQGAVLALNSQSAIQTTVRGRINDDSASVATVNVTYPGAFPNQSVRVQISSYPFKPVTFLALKTAVRLTVTAEFRHELQ